MMVGDPAGSAALSRQNKIKLHPDLGFFNILWALCANSWTGFILQRAESPVLDWV